MSYVNKRGHVCRNAAEKLELVTEYHEGGESLSSFCADKNISKTTFYGWLNAESELKAKVAAKGGNIKGKFISVSSSEPGRTPEQEDLNHHSLAITFRLGSVLNLEYRRSSKC